MAVDWQLITQIGYAVIAAAVVLQALKQLIYYPFLHPLAKFPGPYWASVSRLWIAKEFYNGTEIETVKKLHEKHGQSLH